MEPRVGIAHIDVAAPDGTFVIGRASFPDFARYARLGVHVQSDRVRIATPPPAYVDAALAVLADACRELGIPFAEVAFVDTVVPPPTYGLRYGFKGSYTTDRPTVIWIFANWTRLDELRTVVRHEAAHLAFARTHSAEESAGHTGPSEDFALAFERATSATVLEARTLRGMGSVIDYVELAVDDLAEAKAFYGKALGWAFNEYGDDYAGIKDPGKPDHEFGGLNPHPASSRGDGVLALVRSDDVDGALASVLAAGGRIHVELHEYPGGRRFMFADPWGNILGVYQPSK